jgi:hypothetical protein
MDEPSIRALIGQGEAASVAQHIREAGQPLEELGSNPSHWRRLEGSSLPHQGRVPLLDYCGVGRAV